MRLKCTACLLLFLLSCKNPEKAFVDALEMTSSLLDLLLAQRQRPERARENRDLADFLKKNLKTIDQRLNETLNFRRKNPAAFDELFLKYRTRIVSMLSKLELIHRHERLTMRYLPLIFAPLDTYAEVTEMNHFRNLFMSYYEYIYAMAVKNLE